MQRAVSDAVMSVVPDSHRPRAPLIFLAWGRRDDKEKNKRDKKAKRRMRWAGGKTMGLFLYRERGTKDGEPVTATLMNAGCSVVPSWKCCTSEDFHCEGSTHLLLRNFNLLWGGAGDLRNAPFTIRHRTWLPAYYACRSKPPGLKTRANRQADAS
jgi:hypothetical protein